jgi:hypothetical protein
VLQVMKCPCCGRAAEHLAFRNIEAHGPDDEVISTIVLACPGCDLMLGASINPSEYVAAMLRQIRNNRMDDEPPGAHARAHPLNRAAANQP